MEEHHPRIDRCDRRNREASSLILVLLLILSLPATLAAASPELQVTRVTNQVIVVHGGGGNVTAVRTTSGILMTDSFISPGAGQEARRLIETHFQSLPIKYLVNTHHHFDHIAGNQHFRDAVIIAHVNIVKHMDKYRAELSEEHEDDGTLSPALADFVPTDPSILISSDILIHLGGKTFEILHFGNAHTDNDLVVLDREDKLLIMGDLLCPGKSYILGPGSDTRGWIALLDELIARSNEYELVVAGHGAVVVDVSALDGQREYLIDLWNAVTDAHTRGLTLEQAKRAIDLEKYKNNIKYDKIGLDIEACWNQME
jgi:glyoxylase-like metal-dependent hydrolase (beta-lactamase superfamily II)